MKRRASAATRSFGCLLVAAALASGTALAQPAQPESEETFESVISSEALPLKELLRPVAHRLLGDLPEGKVWFERLYEVPEFRSGAEFEKYRVMSEQRGPLGELLRMRVYHDAGTVLDLAVQPDGDGIGKTALLREAQLGGKPVPRFGEMLKRLEPHAISDYAVPLSKLFASLAYVVQSSEGAGGPSLTAEEVARLRLTVDQKHPPMSAGTQIPPFGGTDLQGRPFDSGSLQGKRAIVLAASVTHRMSRDIMAWTHRYQASRPGRFELVYVLADQRDSVDQYRARGGQLGAKVLVDSDDAIHGALGVGFIPCLYVFDASGANVLTLRAPWKTEDDFAAALDAVR
ncbi:MAG: hypothetical protein HY816_00495 [Candidatus Wallbacteria bacterium]|nr:hypothetical protein [Candidatus Wallbacteria bacterium]